MSRNCSTARQISRSGYVSGDIRHSGDDKIGELVESTEHIREVIVVDDDSTDGTSDRARDAGAWRWSNPLRWGPLSRGMQSSGHR
jgi:hypothetical protein